MLPERGAARPASAVAFPPGVKRVHVPALIEHLFEYWFGSAPGSQPAMPASPGRSFFQIPRDEPDQGAEKPRTAQPKRPVSEEFLP